MEGSMEEGLRLALRQIIQNRAEYGSEEDWACQVGALEEALEVISALREWREARLAILGRKMKSEPDAEQMALWDRLSRSEHSLMQMKL